MAEQRKTPIGSAIRAICLTAILATGSLACAAEPALLPRPASDVAAAGSFTVTTATPVAADPHDKAATDAAQRFLELLSQSGAVALKSGPGTAANSEAIRFVTDSKIAGAEAYRLTVAPTGITIAASHPAGLFYGAVTLWQLLTVEPGPNLVVLNARLIDDAPRFSWRGLMLDSARHMQSPDYIRHFLDWMAIHKLNVLHWHLTDDQGWRIEIKHYPKLTDIGAWRVPAGAAIKDIDPDSGKPRLYGGFYTQSQIRDIVAYGQARHITIVPEIDMPGHATAAIAAYPELGVPPVAINSPSSDWGQFPNLLNVDDRTFDFIETVLGEVIDLFPSAYIHLGGDEAIKDQWKGSAATQARMKELGIHDEEALQSYFMGRLEAFLEQHGRKMIGWDEILQGGIGPQATVMSWRGIDGALTAAKSGHDTILSPWPLLYFDNRQGDSPAEPPGRGHLVTVQDVLAFDPMPAELAPADRPHVLGVQANLWTEHMRTEQQVTKMAFPRAAALAEIAWSPAGSLDWPDFSARLQNQRRRYPALGLSDDAVGPWHPTKRRYSQELKLCSDKLTLSLEDDSPTLGDRAKFLIDIMNPCWIYPAAKIGKGTKLTVAVGQVPFNFQIGKDRDTIHLQAPHSLSGELEVRADRCEGPPVATLPLDDAVASDGVTRLSTALHGLSGRHDLCFTFTGKSIDPMWAIDWIELDTKSERP